MYVYQSVPISLGIILTTEAQIQILFGENGETLKPDQLINKESNNP